MQKISDWFKEHVGFDGLLHIVISAALVCALKLVIGGLFAVVAVALLGIGKEIWDRRTGKGCAEFKDLVCDLAGVIIGVL